MLFAAQIVLMIAEDLAVQVLVVHGLAHILALQRVKVAMLHLELE